MAIGEVGTVPTEEDLEHLQPLETHFEELLDGEESSPAGTEVGDGLPPPDSDAWGLKPSPLHHTEWIEWHPRHVLMLS